MRWSDAYALPHGNDGARLYTSLMNGWMEVLGLIALVALFTPITLQLKLVDKAVKRIKEIGKEKRK